MTFTAPSVPLFPSFRGLMYPGHRHILSATQSEVAYSGESVGYPTWSIPRYRYELSYSVLRSGGVTTDWETLEGFIKKVKFGAGTLFQFTFVPDSVATEQTFGTGNGAVLVYQLLRTLGTFAEPVYCPSAVTNIKANGVVVSTADWDVSARGIVTFKNSYIPASGAALTWNGAYNWYCRFDDDDEDFSNFAYTFWELQKIAFSTVKIRAS